MTKAEVLTAAIVVLAFGGLLLTYERGRGVSERPEELQPASLQPLIGGKVIAAPGKVEGRTESAELRARLSERIAEVRVQEGDRVKQGDVLVRLDDSQYEAERALAVAELQQAESRLERLLNGARESEIEQVRAEYARAVAEFRGAERAYERMQRLDERQAVSRQTLDDHATRLKSTAAAVAAAHAKLETIEAPPRSDDLAAARAAVESARSRLKIAEVNCERTEIRAPFSGQVLEVDGKPGELTRPDQTEPLIVMADTSRLRVRAEVDEYDALRVRLGQSARVRADGVPDTELTGNVVRVAPSVHRKRLFEDRPGERLDSYLRYVWIELEGRPPLPIGLPVDAFLQVNSTADRKASSREADPPGKR